MKSLFNDKDKYTKEADDLDRKTTKLIEELFDEYVNNGFSIRDIASVMKESIHMFMLMKILRSSRKKD
jgi:hypothetical protein